MNPIGVMQMIDTLDTGGAERVAVNIANYLPRERYASYLCTTRKDGALEASIEPHVGRLRLNRRHTFDTAAGRDLVKFIKAHNIKILHPHGASLFLAGIASAFAPGMSVVWHDHFGRVETEERPGWLYKLASARADAIIAVNNLLAEWSRSRLRFPANRVWYVPNFVDTYYSGETTELPGQPGKRIVCVANFRPQKDHLNMLRAFALVIQKESEAHLLLVGPTTATQHFQEIQHEVAALGLVHNVSFLGQRTDVPAILRACDIGVLSSASEGLPLSLLEYGAAGMAAVATRVGQCAEVLDEGRAGLLVPPSSPAALAEAILAILTSTEKRRRLALRLRERIQSHYSAESAMRQICDIYDTVLGNAAPAPANETSPLRSHATAKAVQR